jgi:hypothetical protein
VRLVFGLFIVVIMLAAMTIGITSTLEHSAQGETVVNETFTPPSGKALVTYNESNRDDALYNRSVTVYNESDAVMTEPEDYEWLHTNGTLITNATGDLEGDASANITYGYLDSTETQIALSTLVGYLPSLFGLALPVLMVLVFLRYLVG